MNIKFERGAPAWAVEYLGHRVQLSKPYTDACGRSYPAGAIGRLESIQAGTQRQPFCTVILDEDGTAAEDNFQFSDIRPL